MYFGLIDGFSQILLSSAVFGEFKAARNKGSFLIDERQGLVWVSSVPVGHHESQPTKPPAIQLLVSKCTDVRRTPLDFILIPRSLEIGPTTSPLALTVSYETSTLSLLIRSFVCSSIT